MDFFDNLSQKIADAGETAYQKGKDFADTKKAEMDIKEENRKIDAAYAEIGRRFAEAHPADAERDYGEVLDRIKASKDAIERCRAEIREIKHISLCPKCGGEVGEGMAFCSHCGAKIN